MKRLIYYYKEFFKILKQDIQAKLLPAVAKIVPKVSVHKTFVGVTEIPPGTKEEVLTAEIIRLKSELEKLRKENEELKAKLDEKRKELLAKFLKEVVEEELKRKQPLDLLRILSRLKLARLPFVKKISVLSFDHEFLGYWEGIEILPGGGFRLKIYDPKEKKVIYSPQYYSFIEAFVDAYNIDKQLQGNVLVINAVRDPRTGELIKLDLPTLNEFYAGVPAKQIVAKFLKEVEALRYELGRERVLRELTSIKAAETTAENEYLKELNKAILNLMEAKERNIGTILPYAFAGIMFSDIHKFEAARAEAKAHAFAEKARTAEAKLKKILEQGDIEKLMSYLYSLIDYQQKILSELSEIKSKLEKGGSPGAT